MTHDLQPASTGYTFTNGIWGDCTFSLTPFWPKPGSLGKRIIEEALVAMLRRGKQDIDVFLNDAISPLGGSFAMFRLITFAKLREGGKASVRTIVAILASRHAPPLSGTAIVE